MSLFIARLRSYGGRADERICIGRLTVDRVLIDFYRSWLTALVLNVRSQQRSISACARTYQPEVDQRGEVRLKATAHIRVLIYKPMTRIKPRHTSACSSINPTPSRPTGAISGQSLTFKSEKLEATKHIRMRKYLPNRGRPTGAMSGIKPRRTSACSLIYAKRSRLTGAMPG